MTSRESGGRRFVLAVLCASFLVACSSTSDQPSAPAMTLTPSSKAPVSSVVVTDTQIPVPTLRPTPDSAQLASLGRLLGLDACILPCYIDVTPGKTSISDAQAIVESTGASLNSEEERGDIRLLSYSLTVWPGADSKPTPAAAAQRATSPTRQEIGIASQEDFVRLIQVEVNSGDDIQQFDHLWSAYSFDALIRRLGEPESIVVSVHEDSLGYGLGLMYLSGSVEVELWGSRVGEDVCPGSELHHRTLRMRLKDPSFDPPPQILDAADLTDSHLWTSSTAVFGQDAHSIVERLHQDASSCFQIIEFPK